MSYSRWGSRGSGFWYTYWESKKTPDTWHNALFCVFGVETFTAKELREDMAGCMAKVQETAPEGDIEELEKYAREFLEDVDKDFPKKWCASNRKHNKNKFRIILF